MRMRWKNFFVPGFVLITLVWSLNLLSADQSESAGETWQMATKGANIQEFVDQVAKITGKTFIVDPKLKGQVTKQTVVKLTPKSFEQNCLI